MIEISRYRCEKIPAIGTLLLAFRDQKLVSLDFDDFRDRFDCLLRKRWLNEDLLSASLPETMRTRLDAYFSGHQHAFDGLELQVGGTGFQAAVWTKLRDIPYGQTCSYGSLAGNVGNVKASRAVGRANSLNPVAIVIPCHRVIGHDNKLGGYAGGPGRKKCLLHHEDSTINLSCA